MMPSSPSSAGRFAAAVAFLMQLSMNGRVDAAIYNFQGTNYAPWDVPGNWSPDGPPTVTDEVWMNTASTSASVSSSTFAKNLVVGRHATGVGLRVEDGGEVRVGSAGTGSGVLFVGQYDDAEGTVEIRPGAKVTVENELAVSIFGPGTWEQTGGIVEVGGRFVVGRYDAVQAVGYVRLSGGTLRANRFEMNGRSSLRLEGGVLVLDGDDTAKVNQHLGAGRITGNAGGSGTNVEYDPDADRTYVFGNVLVYNYYGTVAASWSAREHWQRDVVPNRFEEAWLDTADASLTIGPDDVAELKKLVVARNKKNVQLNIEGGSLDVGFKNGDFIFVGQYGASSGFVAMTSGSVKVKDELAVAVSGPGSWTQSGGTVQVGGRFIIGRYSKVEAAGTVILSGGTISADRFQMNDYSKLEFAGAGGALFVNGDKQSLVNSYVSSGKITAVFGSIVVSYDGTQTKVTSSATGPVTTDAPTEAPTNMPVVAPSSKPTDVPTSSPTSKPTDAPTLSPTSEPTDAPSGIPTDAPTPAPAPLPTTGPVTTNAPTEEPTNKPTTVPLTMVPTASPTEVPTSSPTSKPTNAPTSSPTSKPTDVPIPAPAPLPTVSSSPVRYDFQPTSTPASWTDIGAWKPSTGVLPRPVDAVWMTTSGVRAYVDSGEAAACSELIVARHVPDVSLEVRSGSTLDVSSSVLFVGQYEASDGTLTVRDGAVVTVAGEFAVSVSGAGELYQYGGTIDVAGRLAVGRYDKVQAVGYVLLAGGTLAAGSFDMNVHSTIEIAGGTLVIGGNVRSKIQGHIDAGRIVSSSGAALGLTYDGSVTTLSSPSPAPTGAPTAAPPTPAPVTSSPTPAPAPTPAVTFQFQPLFPGGNPVPWSDPSNWSPSSGNPPPDGNDPVWFNRADARAYVDDSGSGPARCHDLVVGRHAPGCGVEVRSGGELRVAGASLFVGQYSDASGTLTVQDGATVTVASELNVALAGGGQLYQYGGTIAVAGRLVVGRYDNAEAVGYVRLDGGTLTASRLDMNANRGEIVITEGRLIIPGDAQSRMQTFVDDGRITSPGTISVSYDGSDTVVASDAPAPTTTTTTTTTVPTTTTTTATTTPFVPPTGPWDVTGILSFTPEQVGPIMPETTIDKSTMSIRTFGRAPSPGVHPRIFFGPEDLPSVRANLEDTTVGADALKNARQLTALMVDGRDEVEVSPGVHGGYNAIPQEERLLPDGKTNRVSNAGLFGATHGTYLDLLAGSCAALEAQQSTHWNAVAGAMALEALDCLVFPDRADADASKRASDLGAVMATWAGCALSNPNFGSQFGHGSQAMRDIFGGQHMALAYDLNYHAMTDEQRDVVRRGIAKMIWVPSKFTGITNEPYATTSNWVTINSFVPLMVMSVEGETTEEEHGWSTSELESYFKDIMMANYKFITYGFYADGSPYEGSGKNYQYNTMMPAYARRGYNFYAHKHVQAYARDFLPKQMQPFGHYMTSYDTIGGSGLSPIWGKQRYHSFDVVGVKWGFPSDPSVDFLWRNYAETPYVDDGGVKRTMLDVADGKITARSTYSNSMLSLLMMPSDYDASGDFETRNQEAQRRLTFFGSERGLINTRSGYDADALSTNLHIRQDTGGHTFGDRNSFTLSALGRIWVRNPVGYIPETEWQSSILVDGVGVTITEQDGRKARQPGRIAAHQDEPLATFTMGDATYAYNTEWRWGDRMPGSNFIWSGWEACMETWNDFRSSKHQIPYYYGDVAFYDYAHWEGGGMLEGINKRQVNDLSQFFRQAGLVRGPRPYLLIVDDVHKMTGGNDTTWSWIAQMAEDLNPLPTAQYAGNLDASTDIVFVEATPDVEKEAESDRRLLVRILSAEGARPDGKMYTYTDHTHPDNKLWYESGRTPVARRLAIERSAEWPRFRIMLYPYREGDPIPSSTVQGGGLVQAWGTEQVDSISFHTAIHQVGGQSVELTGIEISRNGQSTSIIDTRGEAEPMPVRW